jgi:hypothetical protein
MHSLAEVTDAENSLCRVYIYICVCVCVCVCVSCCRFPGNTLTGLHPQSSITHVNMHIKTMTFRPKRLGRSRSNVRFIPLD